jgi:hypothetical protein
MQRERLGDRAGGPEGTIFTMPTSQTAIVSISRLSFSFIRAETREVSIRVFVCMDVVIFPSGSVTFPRVPSMTAFGSPLRTQRHTEHQEAHHQNRRTAHTVSHRCRRTNSGFPPLLSRASEAVLRHNTASTDSPHSDSHRGPCLHPPHQSHHHRRTPAPRHDPRGPGNWVVQDHRPRMIG